jgi:hypothetical protein
MRQFVEFIHSQALSWTTSSTGGAWKQLSQDSDDALSLTALVRLEPGEQAVIGAHGRSLELFVLKGGLRLGTTDLGLHGYAYRPAGAQQHMVDAPGGATVLVLTDPPAGPVDDAAITLDTLRLPWDRKGLESEIAHLNYARKNLRLAPDGGRRSYLLGGMPHGIPHDGARLERHPHAEEMFMISGDMPCSLGVMTAGAYFHRPPQIWHGLDATLSGFLIFMRTPGSNVTVSEWSDTLLPVRLDPDHAPALPSGVSLSAHPPRPLVGDY